MEDGMKIVSDRWMLQSRQIVNWGSYGGYHVFRPSMDDAMPVTLLAGASESGKSTLVDAQISLLYPSGTPYNKASNSGRSERNDYTYLRGMIGISDGENRSSCAAGTRTAPRRTSGARSSTHTRTAATADCCPAQNSST